MITAWRVEFASLWFWLGHSFTMITSFYCSLYILLCIIFIVYNFYSIYSSFTYNISVILLKLLLKYNRNAALYKKAWLLWKSVGLKRFWYIIILSSNTYYLNNRHYRLIEDNRFLASCNTIQLEILLLLNRRERERELIYACTGAQARRNVEPLR